MRSLRQSILSVLLCLLALGQCFALEVAESKAAKNSTVAFFGARVALTHKGEPKQDELERILTSMGFHDNQGMWVFQDTMGAVMVVPLYGERRFVLSYGPTGDRPVPEHILAALIQKADSLDLSKGDEGQLSFGLESITGGTQHGHMSQSYEFSLQSWSWRATTITIDWSQQSKG